MMLSMNDAHAIAAELFETIHSLTRQLLTVLESEACALSARHHGELEALATEKRTIAANLEKATARQQALLQSLGLPDSKDGIVMLLARLSGEGMAVTELYACWEQVHAFSKRCQSLNQSNGASIELLHRHFTRALRILYGQISPANTYGPDGTEKTVLVPLSRALV